jgi:hypothetical protein
MRRCLPIAPLTLVACSANDPGPAVRSAMEIGVLEQSERIVGRDGGCSAWLWDRSVWFYGDTVLSEPDEDGVTWHHNSVSITFDTDASDGLTGFEEPRDSVGAPRHVVAPTEWEHAFNLAHWGDDCLEEPCGARYAAWPGAAVYDAERERALVFYGLIYAEPGDFNFTGVGSSLAVWNDPDEDAIRPVVDPDAEHPTLLFGPDTPSFGVASTTIDETLYTFACDQDGFAHVCRLARVALADAFEVAAWQMWDGSGWSGDFGRAATLFEGAPIMSLSHVPALDAWMLVYSPPFDREVVARTAPELTGPWSAPSVLYRAPSDEDPPYDVLHHAEYEEQDGLVQYVTYSRRTTGWFGAEFPIVRIELEPN